MKIETYSIEAQFEVAIKTPDGSTTDATSLASGLRAVIVNAVEEWRKANERQAFAGPVRMDVRRQA